MPPQASVLCQDLPAMHVPAPFTTTLLQSLKTHRPSLEHQAPGVNSPHTAVFPTLDAMRVRQHDTERLSIEYRQEKRSLWKCGAMARRCNDDIYD
jgi:hypothetical protein